MKSYSHTEETIRSLTAGIRPADTEAMRHAAVRWNSIAKPLHGMGRLEDLGIHAQVHYPIPVHLQKAYRDLGYRRGDFPAAEKLAETEISLPLYPGMREEQIQYVLDALNRF